MAAFIIITYDVTNPEEYAKYNPGSLPTIMKTIGAHGGEVLVAGKDTEWLAEKRDAAVVIKFPTVEAAKAWHDDPDYAAAKAIRLASTTNIQAFIAPQFVMPS